MKFASILLATALTTTTTTAFVPLQHSLRSSCVAQSVRSSRHAMPICIVVEAEIKEDRIEEFLGMIEKNAIGSRAEPGCIRFDVLQAEDSPNKFYFYEIYENGDAIAYHKEQSHYLAWAAFKDSGGTISSVTKKANGTFLT